MKNLVSRDEYIQRMNEGFIKDTIKKGVDKIKSLFKIGMKKIKDFIVIFDNNGNILPVVSPQAIIDNFAEKKGINVYASSKISDSVVDAGGKRCDTKAPEHNDEEVYDFGPKGKEFAKWMKGEKYKDSIEYKNLMSVPELIQECYNCSSDEAKELFEGMISEDWEKTKTDRVKYGNDGSELGELKSLTVNDFEEKLNKMIEDTIINGGKTVKRDDGKVKKPWRNMLIFGAPGIGKSTVPNIVIGKYNENANSAASEMSLITVDCPNIAVGDFMMPTMPQPKMVIDIINKNPEAFPQAKEYLEGLTPEQEEMLDKSLKATKQFEANSAPKSWLPSYKKTGDDKLDILLDSYANGGVYTDDEGHTHKTGNGGIIMFDEFLRTDPNVFKQLMIFLLTRELEGWTLGSKWVIIACSNRPCDDQEVASVWKQWNGGPAAKDRFERMYHLEPNPEQWQKWARSKGCDEFLLKFIFDESSKVGDGEYPRWHSMVKNSAKGGQILPISPRRWQSAFEAINSFEIDEDYDDISQMTSKEIKDCLGGIFDESFIVEIVDWLEDHMNSVDLESIIKDPKNTYLPKKFSGKDQAKAAILIRTIWEQFESKYKEHPEDCSDDDLANIIAWMGMNYRGDMHTFLEEFIEKLDTILLPGSDNRFSNHIKSLQMMFAAYPMTDMEKSIKALEDSDQDPWPENSFETIKDMMKEYFPWRLDGDRIKYYDALDAD